MDLFELKQLLRDVEGPGKQTNQNDDREVLVHINGSIPAFSVWREIKGVRLASTGEILIEIDIEALT